MLSRRMLKPGRITSVRPLRPPSLAKQPSAPRLFTQNTQLLLITPHPPRPQLPYLAQPAFRRPQPLAGPSQQLARLLTTENKTYVRDQVWLAAKWTGIAWAFLVLGYIAYFGLIIEGDERRNPTPAEWTFFTRQGLRAARANMLVVEQNIAGFIDWARVGTELRKCLLRLEQPAYDGKGIEQQEVGIDPAIGEPGLDISAKSHEWRTGYFEVVMSCAAAAEHLDGMVLDTTRSTVFPKEVVVGPSNPDARPVPGFVGAAPLEENCVAPYPPPEKFYLRVLTTTGFTTRQKMEAALAYANWLEFQALPDSASEMYKWGMDIARSGLPVPADTVIDSQTNIMKAESVQNVTPNLLRAATSFAIHQARTGDLASALPILLSVLRARRTASIDFFPSADNIKAKEEASTDIGAAINLVRRAFQPPSFPPPPPTGDEPFTRTSERPTCAESELMLYIGEILFATSQQSQEGIGWTRSAVNVAEANIQTLPGSNAAAAAESKKCKECLLTGVGNWETMLRRLSEEQAEEATREGGRTAGLLEWRGWFGGDGGVKGKTLDEAAGGVIDQELRQVERLKETILREGIAEEMANAKGAQTGGTWIG